MSDKCKNCGDPVQIELPDVYDIALCLKCGIFLVAGYRLRAEMKGPAEVARIESIICYLEEQYKDKPVRKTVAAIEQGLRKDPDWRKTMMKMRERHEER